MTNRLRAMISLLLVVILCVGMVPGVSATEIDETGSTEANSPTETTTIETDPTTETNPTEDEAAEETIPSDEEATLLIMSLEDGVATLAETEIVGAPNAFATLFLWEEIQIPSFDHMQSKIHIPLYSVYLKNQPGYENNYYVAYCIEPGVELGNSGGHGGSSTTIGGMTDGSGALTNLSREQVSAMGVALLYGQKEIARKADEESVRMEKLRRHAATQIIVWEIACGWRSAEPPYTCSNTTLYDAVKPELEIASDVWGTKFMISGITDAYDEIEAQMAQHYTIPSFTAATEVSAPTYELALNSSGQYTLTLTDSNNILDKYTFANTGQLTFSVSGNKLTITASGPISETLISATKQVHSLDDQVFYVWEYQEQQKLMSCKSEPTYDPVPAYFKVRTSSGSVAIKKTTQDGKNLSGWQFGIYSDEACTKLISGPYTTDSDGNIAVANLSPGTVYVKEIGHSDAAINSLYKCDGTNPQKVSIVSGQTATVSFYNKLNVGDIKLIKTTNTGSNVGGWQIGIYTDAACTKPIAGSPFTTESDGTIAVSNLMPGTYYAKEIPTNDTYWECDSSVKTVTVVANKTATVTFKNVHYGRIKVIKTMEAEGSVEGWQFRIYDSDGNEIEGSPFTSNADGIIITDNILLGTYTVEELLPEDSLYYCQSENPQTITVMQGQTSEVTFTNALRPGKIILYKVDTTGTSLAGATFLLEWSEDGTNWTPIHYSAGGDVSMGGCSNSNVVDGCLTSREDGLIEWDNLCPGILYRVTEVAAPDGYSLLNEPVYEGALPSEDLTIEFTVINVHTFTLPETGSFVLLTMQMIGFISMTVSIVLTATYRKRRA